MSFNGSGTFVINSSGQPVVTGTTISSTVFNALTADLATGLSTTITKDGQTATTLRIPFALGINSTLVTDSSSTTTGSIITAGGVGIAKAAFIGTTLNVAGVITGIGTGLTGTAASLTAGTATGANALYSATTTVNVSSATAPTAGQALVATGASAAVWSEIGGPPNLLINPNWQIDQINEGALYTVNAADVRGPDGWSGSAVGAGVFKLRTLADPDNAALKCCEITCTTADASLAATDDYFIYSAIEGYDAAALQFGTSGAQTMTVQFKFKTSVTGVYGLSIANSALNRRYIGTITVADTSEHEYSVTLTADTSGTWLYTNGVGLYLRICLAAGSNFQGTASAWAAGAEQTTASQANFMSSTSNIAYLKRIQLIPGSVVQSYRAADIQKELAKCQRYYEKSFPQGTAPAVAVGVNTGEVQWLNIAGGAAANVGIQRTFVVPKRATPTATLYSPAIAGNEIYDNNAAAAWTASTAVNLSTTAFRIQGTQPAGSGVTGLSLVHFAATARLS